MVRLLVGELEEEGKEGKWLTDQWSNLCSSPKPGKREEENIGGLGLRTGWFLFPLPSFEKRSREEWKGEGTNILVFFNRAFGRIMKEEEKILPKKALLRQGLHLPDQHSTSL